MRKENDEWHFQTHPYPPFVPEKAEILLLGSAPPFRFCTGDKANLRNRDFDYYYGSSSNLFWEILFGVFEPENLTELDILRKSESADRMTRKETKSYLQSFLTRHKLALTDILSRFLRCGESAADYQLHVLEYHDLVTLLQKHRSLKAICCTSKNRVFFWLWQYLEIQACAGLIEPDENREGFILRNQTENLVFSTNHDNPIPHPGLDPGSLLIARDSCFRRNEGTGSFLGKTEQLEKRYIQVKILPSPSARGIMRFANRAEFIRDCRKRYREILLQFYPENSLSH
jgi:G:T/U-mismatch repair DNA glycosylase